MNNNKGTVLLLTVIFVLIFSILGLLSMRLAVMHNTEINKDLTAVRMHYAAESALEQAAFRMALISQPIRVAAGTPNAAVINAINPRFPSVSGANDTVWYLDEAGVPKSAVIARSGTGGAMRWYPLGADGILDNSLAPAIRTTVEVQRLTGTDIRAIDGTTQYDPDGTPGGTITLPPLNNAQIAQVTASLLAVRNKIFDVVFDENNKRIFTGTYVNGVRLCVSSVEITGNDIYFNINYSSSSVIGPPAQPLTSSILTNNNAYNSDAGYSSAQHGYPATMRSWLGQMIEEIIGREILKDNSGLAAYYRIRSTARLDTPNPAFPDKTLEFYYVVVENTDTTVTIDMNQFSTQVFNNGTYNSGNSTPSRFLFKGVDFNRLANVGMTGTNNPPSVLVETTYRNIFRSRK